MNNLDHLESSISTVCNMLARDDSPPRNEISALLKRNFLNVLNEQEQQQQTIQEICHLFSIGENVRTHSALITNIENAKRRSDCLSKIEFYLSINETDENGDVNLESLLNWGESPDKYLETFKKVLAAQHIKGDKSE